MSGDGNTRFCRIGESDDQVSILVNGRTVSADARDSVAAILLLEGYLAVRVNRPSSVERAPFCMMGTCFDCLVTVDGELDVQSCLTPVREGMQIMTGSGVKRSCQA